MANHKSALKKVRQDTARRERNRAHRSRLRTAVKKLRGALDAGDAKAAGELLAPTLAVVDRSAKLGVIHANAAARTKSRIERALRKIS